MKPLGLRARDWPSRAARFALDCGFPPRCSSCRAWCDTAWHESPFCAKCVLKIRELRAPICPRCGLELRDENATCPDCALIAWPQAMLMARAAAAYDGPLGEAVQRFKYNGKTALAPGLAAMMARWLRAQPTLPALPVERVTLLVPAPMHAWRKWRRGFNQSELLARELSRQLDIPTANLLRRARYTAPQMTLSGNERRQNLTGTLTLSRRASPELLRGAILLIDDVTTTGATTCECAQVLQNAGATEIYALSLARA